MNARGRSIHGATVVAIVTAAVVACAGCARTLPPAPVAHYILTHKEGDPIDRGRNKLHPEEFRELYLDKILMGIDEYVAHIHEKSDLPGHRTTPVPILLYIHGGMNRYAPALARVTELVECERGCDETTGQATESGWGRLYNTNYYPVFVNWNSSLWSSLFDDIFIVRNGERQPTVGSLTAPFILAGRLAESGFSVLKALYFFAREDHKPDPAEVDPDYGITYVPLGPVRGLGVPVLQAFGMGAWEIMKRRADFVTSRWLPEQGSIGRLRKDGNRQGAARTLMEHLMARLCADKRDPLRQKLYWPIGHNKVSTPARDIRECNADEDRQPVQLTVVGHSMGTLIVNRLLQAFPQVPFSKIVHLAAASSINDFHTFVVPYLHHHQDARFFGISLSMNDERFEKGWGDLYQRGSLLLWIDHLFERVSNLEELRSGRFVNLCQTTATHELGHEEARIKFAKVTGHENMDPRYHGGFGKRERLAYLINGIDTGNLKLTYCDHRPGPPVQTTATE